MATLQATKIHKSWVITTASGQKVSGNYHKTKKSALQEGAEFEALLPADVWVKENPFEDVDGALKDALIAVKRKWRV